MKGELITIEERVSSLIYAMFEQMNSVQIETFKKQCRATAQALNEAKLLSKPTTPNIEERENQVKNLMQNLTNLCGTDLGDETQAYILIYEFAESIIKEEK